MYKESQSFFFNYKKIQFTIKPFKSFKFYINSYKYYYLLKIANSTGYEYTFALKNKPKILIKVKYTHKNYFKI